MTMSVLIVGGGGMLGQRLARKLTADGSISGRPISRIHLVDLRAPDTAGLGGTASAEAADIVEGDLKALVGCAKPDVVFHLAAIVSGEAEQNFALGYAVNVLGTTRLLEALRDAGAVPRFVFSSSLAVFGGELPATVPDTYRSTPKSSYGAQKAIGEILVADYTRKGYVDGISLRLPTITVRPGSPNKAASSFLSGIIREPLAGRESILPVGDDAAAWIASPDVAVRSLVHAAGLDTARIGDDRALTGRGITVTIGEMVAALERIAGPKVAARIQRVPDAAIAAIVGSWPRAFACDAAARLGFPADTDIDAIIQAHIAGELGGRFAA